MRHLYNSVFVLYMYSLQQHCVALIYESVCSSLELACSPRAKEACYRQDRSAHGRKRQAGAQRAQ